VDGGFIYLKTFWGRVGRLNSTVKRILWELLLRSFAQFLHQGRYDIIVPQPRSHMTLLLSPRRN